MNSKIITLISILISTSLYSQVNKQEASQSIENFRTKGDDAELARSLSATERDQSITESARVELMVNFLITVNQYLIENPKPQGTPQLNIAPPDGGISGADPSSVKDPKERATYISMIAENKVLTEQHRKYDALLSMRKKILGYCISFRKMKDGNEQVIKTLLEHSSNDAKQTKELLDIIQTPNG